MNTQLLIDAIVRQTTVLIAQLATAGGARTPLADIASQVFVDLARELERQGVSRKVAADMFGMALRTYRRKVQRLAESRTTPGRSLWEAVHDFIGAQPVVTRAEVLRRFDRDDGEIVRSVLSDLVESGLVYRAGRGPNASYRVATRAELDYVQESARDADGTDTLVCAVVYRSGPMQRDALAAQLSIPTSDLDASLARLVAASRLVYREDTGTYTAESFVIPLGEERGWEAAVFDHFQAVVTTVCAKLGGEGSTARAKDDVGGSTYTLEVWPGHPLEEEARGELRRFREHMTELRERIAAHNRGRDLPKERSRVVIYGGQHVIDFEDDVGEET